VSRTPVREALRRLADERLAIRLANRGTIVAPMSLDDVLSVYLVREQQKAWRPSARPSTCATRAMRAFARSSAPLNCHRP
jgi:DNA-binding FadR family transcriptional regulator